MGEFAELVKEEKMLGPHARRFVRGDWETIHRERDTNPEDKRWLGQVSFLMMF